MNETIYVNTSRESQLVKKAVKVNESIWPEGLSHLEISPGELIGARLFYIPDNKLVGQVEGIQDNYYNLRGKDTKVGFNRLFLFQANLFYIYGIIAGARKITASVKLWQSAPKILVRF